jgi:hypothetical protein
VACLEDPVVHIAAKTMKKEDRRTAARDVESDFLRSIVKRHLLPPFVGRSGVIESLFALPAGLNRVSTRGAGFEVSADELLIGCREI